MNINKKISKVNRTLLTSKENKFIVIHYVGAVSTAKNNADYFYEENRGASAHYFVDENEIWQVVETYNAAWHVGGASQYYNDCRNMNSIGIEMCCKKDENGAFYIDERVTDKTVELTKELMKQYNIPIENVVRHWDCTRKCCPEPWIRDESKWIEFKDKLLGEPSEEEQKKYIQEKCGFDDNTMFWLSRYLYHVPLFKKWYNSYKKEERIP